MRGEILNQRYEIIMRLVTNKKHNIYLVNHIKLNTLWVIKRWSRSNINNMQMEMNVLKRLNHPCIPRVIDCFEKENDVFLVEDYFEGNTLKEIIQEKKKINEEKVLKWFRQLADVLNYLHCLEPNPIIYNDIKPSNIIVTSNESIKLIDFESARKKGHTTSCLGTIGYAAPEQYYGNINETTDIYSLGIMMYRILTGYIHNLPIFNIDIEKNPRLSKKATLIIRKCTQLNPQMRYQNITELLKDLNK